MDNDNLIYEFIWGYQRHYRVYANGLAKRVLDELDECLSPEVFLVGVADDQNKIPICVEPENEFWLKSHSLKALRTLALTKHRNHPSRQIFHTHPTAQENHDRRIEGEALRDALLETVLHLDASKERVFYSTFPITVGQYKVLTVLSVNQAVVSDYYSLTKSEIPISEITGLKVSRSLIESAIFELLGEFQRELNNIEPGRDSLSTSTAEILGRAGHRLMCDVAYRVDQQAMSGWHSLWDFCNSVSSMQYEREESKGGFVIARENNPCVLSTIKFLEPSKTKQIRHMRKLLEVTSKDSLLHTNSEQTFGLASIRGPNTDEDCFSVEVEGNATWRLAHNYVPMMVVHYGRPRLPKRSNYAKRIEDDLPRIIRNVQPDAIERLVALTVEVERQRRGALIVISSDAAGEVKRLSAQATSIQPCHLTSELLHQLSSIDGAIMLDSDMKCHGIGIILDGLAIEGGDPGRGARFNSALRYIAGCQERGVHTVTMVLSEDGGVELFPQLHPRIFRSQLVSMLEKLVEASKEEKISIPGFNRIYEWLKRHEFYLTESQCCSANQAIEKTEARLKQEHPLNIHWMRDPLRGSSDINAWLYFLDGNDTESLSD